MFSTARFAFSADNFPGRFQTTREFDPYRVNPVEEYGEDGRPTGRQKLVDGNPVYRVPAQYVDDTGVDSSVSLRVLNRPTAVIPPLATIRLVGNVKLVPYVSRGRIAWSITADGVAVDGGADD